MNGLQTPARSLQREAQPSLQATCEVKTSIDPLCCDVFANQLQRALQGSDRGSLEPPVALRETWRSNLMFASTMAFGERRGHGRKTDGGRLNESLMTSAAFDSFTAFTRLKCVDLPVAATRRRAAEAVR